MVAQTRLDIEGEHLDRFNWNFGTAAWRDSAFPKVKTPSVKTPSVKTPSEIAQPAPLPSTPPLRSPSPLAPRRSPSPLAPSRSPSPLAPRPLALAPSP